MQSPDVVEVSSAPVRTTPTTVVIRRAPSAPSSDPCMNGGKCIAPQKCAESGCHKS